MVYTWAGKEGALVSLLWGLCMYDMDILGPFGSESRSKIDSQRAQLEYHHGSRAQKAPFIPGQFGPLRIPVNASSKSAQASKYQGPKERRTSQEP